MSDYIQRDFVGMIKSSRLRWEICFMGSRVGAERSYRCVKSDTAERMCEPGSPCSNATMTGDVGMVVGSSRLQGAGRDQTQSL